jgi:hypothetical protein
LGIDPAAGPAGQARAAGIPTLIEFFTFEMAERLVREGRTADVIIGNNVLAHVGAINDFVAGCARLLHADGVAIFEIAYAVDMIEKCEFDTIYHEHHFYHTLHGLAPLFARHGLHLNDAERLPIHGGSLRIWVSHDDECTDALGTLMDQERELGADTLRWYDGFAERVAGLRRSLTELLRAEKERGNRIAAYGAAAKGSTLVNSLGLEPNFFEFVADANSFKQGKFTPGQHIPIVHPARLLETRPELVLILAWNFAGEVLRQQAEFRAGGGRFIIPIPVPRVIEPGEYIDEIHFAIAGVPPPTTISDEAIKMATRISMTAKSAAQPGQADVPRAV